MAAVEPSWVAGLRTYAEQHPQIEEEPAPAPPVHSAFTESHDKSLTPLQKLKRVMERLKTETEALKIEQNDIFERLFLENDQTLKKLIAAEEEKIASLQSLANRILLKGCDLERREEIAEVLPLEELQRTLLELRLECKELRRLLSDPSFTKWRSWQKQIGAELLTIESNSKTAPKDKVQLIATLVKDKLWPALFQPEDKKSVVLAQKRGQIDAAHSLLQKIEKVESLVRQLKGSETELLRARTELLRARTELQRLLSDPSLHSCQKKMEELLLTLESDSEAASKMKGVMAALFQPEAQPTVELAQNRLEMELLQKIENIQSLIRQLKESQEELQKVQREFQLECTELQRLLSNPSLLRCKKKIEELLLTLDSDSEAASKMRKVVAGLFQSDSKLSHKRVQMQAYRFVTQEILTLSKKLEPPKEPAPDEIQADPLLEEMEHEVSELHTLEADTQDILLRSTAKHLYDPRVTLPDPEANVYSSVIGSRYYLRRESWGDSYSTETWRVLEEFKTLLQRLKGLHQELSRCHADLLNGSEKAFAEELKRNREIFTTYYFSFIQFVVHFHGDAFNKYTLKGAPVTLAMEETFDQVGRSWLMLHELLTRYPELFSVKQSLLQDLQPVKPEEAFQRSVNFYQTAKGVTELLAKPVADKKGLGTWIAQMKKVRRELVTRIGPEQVLLSEKEELVFSQTMARLKFSSDSYSRIKSFFVKRITSVNHLPLQMVHYLELALALHAWETDIELEANWSAILKADPIFAGIVEDYRKSLLGKGFAPEFLQLARAILFQMQQAVSSHNIIAYAKAWQGLCNLEIGSEKPNPAPLQEFLSRSVVQLRRIASQQEYLWPLLDENEFVAYRLSLESKSDLTPELLADISKKNKNKLLFRAWCSIRYGLEEERAYGKELTKALPVDPATLKPDLQRLFQEVLYWQIIEMGIDYKVGKETEWLLKGPLTAYCTQATFNPLDTTTPRVLYMLAQAAKVEDKEHNGIQVLIEKTGKNYETFMKEAKLLFSK